MTSSATQLTERSRLKADRRSELLRTAASLFAERGFRAVSIEELGAAAGVSGPAVYRHFTSKHDVLAELLVGVSRRLLAGGQQVLAETAGEEEALRRLVSFHTDFALDDPELIRIQDRDLASLASSEARLVRRLQRAYVEIWVSVIAGLDPALSVAEARVKAHAVFGLLNSTPYTAKTPARETVRAVLENMALASLLAS